MAANDGYLPERVNFSLRTMLDKDLIELLLDLGLGEMEGEYAYGHTSATGGSLANADFECLLKALGFQPGAS